MTKRTGDVLQNQPSAFYQVSESTPPPLKKRIIGRWQDDVEKQHAHLLSTRGSFSEKTSPLLSKEEENLLVKIIKFHDEPTSHDSSDISSIAISSILERGILQARTLGRESPALSKQFHHCQTIDTLPNEMAVNFEEQMNESGVTIADLFSNLPGLVTFQKISGEMQYVSSYYRDVLGYDPNNYIALPPFITIHPDDRDHVRALFIHMRNYSSPAPISCRYRILTNPSSPKYSEHKYHTFETHITPIFSSNSSLIGFLSLSRDITEEEQYKTELKKAKLQSEREKEQIQTLSRGITHELKNSVLCILGISSNTQCPPEERIDLIKRHLAKMERDLYDLLDTDKLLSGKFSLHPKNFNLEELLKDSIGHAKNIVHIDDKDLKLSYTISKDVYPILFGDKDRIEQILINLLTNSFKYTDEGKVEILIDVDPTNENMVRFTVKDSGRGIPEDKRANFGQCYGIDTKDNKKGFGIGLTVCFLLSKQLGGAIKLLDSADPGCHIEFSANLPIGKQEKLSKVPSIKERFNNLSDLSILWAEDQTIIQSLYKRFLAQTKHNLTMVSDGSEAIDLIKSNQRFSVICLDETMKQLHGKETAKAIREYEKEQGLSPTPVFLVSGQDDSKDVAFTGSISKSTHMWEDFITKLEEHFLPSQL